MDGAHKSKRLYSSYTLPDLYKFVQSPNLSNAQQEKFQLAINQRDILSSDYVPIFIVPQIAPC
jgi:hypothetical protein